MLDNIKAAENVALNLSKHSGQLLVSRAALEAQIQLENLI